MKTSGNANSGNSSSKLWLSIVVGFAFLVRVGVLLLMPEGLNRDTDAYRKIAEALHSSGTFGFPVPNLNASSDRGADITDVRPTAFRPPLYPLLLAVLVTGGQLLPVAVGGLHVACGVLTVVMVWIIAQKWELGKSATVAAMLTACDPILLNQSTQLMTETLATLAAVVALWGLSNWLQRPSTVNAFLAGLLLGLACLCRPTFLPWSGLVVASCWCIKRSGVSRRSIAVSLLAGIAVVLLPWGIRNEIQFGRLKFTTTHGGYTLLLGNNPSYYRFLREGRWGSVWDSRELDAAWVRRAGLRDADDDLFAPTRLEPPDILRTAMNEMSAVETKRSQPKQREGGPTKQGRVMYNSPAGGRPNFVRTEFDDDRLAYEFAQRYIREAPAMFVVSCLHRVGSLWQILPHRVHNSESTANWLQRWGVAIWYLVVFGFAILGGWRLRGRLLCTPCLWGVLLCVAFTAVHAVYWSNMRMRSPLVPFVSLIAAVGVTSRRLGIPARHKMLS